MIKDTKEFITESKIINILQRLSKIDSTQPEGNEKDVVIEILYIFKDYDIDYKMIDHGKNRASLVITLEGKDNDNSIAFLGHIDTVPVEDYEKWIYPPFDGVIEQGYMYGRGTADMKGGVTSMILTLLYLLENNITPSNKIKFCFTADEEANGIGILAVKENNILDDTKAIFVAEPSNEKIGLAEKGALWLEVNVEGLSAHGSRPELGVNAIEYLFDYIEKFKCRIKNNEVNQLLGKTTISINKFNGGIGTNVIPTEAKANIDIRTIPGHSHDEIIDISESIAQDMMNDKSNLNIKIDVENNRPAIETKRDERFIKNIEQIFKQLKYDFDYKGIYFYTDASQVIPDIKVPFVILGPGDDKMAHQRNEKIKLSSISNITEIYINYILGI
ncbi:M20 family metallopeptidase [Senegalia massiliensis]|uniref:M20 family metallopeptidase n=1 Tax=Senegalia massiliensis TaxID=1720316 RepID=UPI00102F84B7|nr:M20 family metallopeptidase [Senegalia massiliensis]